MTLITLNQLSSYKQLMLLMNSSVRLFGLVAVMLFVVISPIFSCAMSALITRDGFTLDNYPIQGSVAEYWQYNDPWDYFGFVMANSSIYTNSDGYGIVQYRDSSPILSDRHMWYKRVTNSSEFGNKYYTGRFLDVGDQLVHWPWDTFDNAMRRIRQGNDRPAIVMCHARNATGVTYGTHPFTFQTNDRTYSFMHNGNCNPARSFMINRINQMNPNTNWFEMHPSNYFNNRNPLQWVDTEVLFHYLLNYILAFPNDVVSGLNHALAELRPYFVNNNAGVYNFVLSDGSNLYAFRSSPLVGGYSSYKLSYKSFGNEYYAIRTQTPGVNDKELDRMELVVFSRYRAPQHYPEITRLVNNRNSLASSSGLSVSGDGSTTRLIISPNPVNSSSGQIEINLTMPGMSKQSDATISIYNLKGQCIVSRVTNLSGTEKALTLSLPKLPSGVYVCQVMVNGSYTINRFSVVNK